MDTKKEKIELTPLQKKHYEDLKRRRDAIYQQKVRIRRLIKRGAMVETAINDLEGITDEQFQQRLFSYLEKRDKTS